jgi:signal transduction histidine kinase
MLDALAMVKELAPEVPFIVVSGTITEELAVEAIRSGAADCVSKANLARLAPAVARELAAARDRTTKSRRLIETEDAERRRIARGLHDQFGQLMWTLRLALDAARTEPPPQPSINEAIALVDQALQQARDFSVELWPVVLDDFGLPAALRWLAERHARWSGLAIEVDAEDGDRPDFSIEAACFRVAQEALTNVSRHAHASRVDIRWRQSLELEIRDDGRGFEPALAWKQASLGLAGMRERVSLAGGRFTITSRPGAGTAIGVRFPSGAGS